MMALNLKILISRWKTIAYIFLLNFVQISRNEHSTFKQEIIQHANHSTKTKRNDIALIRVTKQISFHAEIAPACIQIELNDLDSNVKLIVSGWGSDAADRMLFL